MTPDKLCAVSVTPLSPHPFPPTPPPLLDRCPTAQQPPYTEFNALSGAVGGEGGGEHSKDDRS